MLVVLVYLLACIAVVFSRDLTFQNKFGEIFSGVAAVETECPLPKSRRDEFSLSCMFSKGNVTVRADAFSISVDFNQGIVDTYRLLNAKMYTVNIIEMPKKSVDPLCFTLLLNDMSLQPIEGSKAYDISEYRAVVVIGEECSKVKGLKIKESNPLESASSLATNISNGLGKVAVMVAKFSDSARTKAIKQEGSSCSLETGGAPFAKIMAGKFAECWHFKTPAMGSVLFYTLPEGRYVVGGKNFVVKLFAKDRIDSNVIKNIAIFVANHDCWEAAEVPKISDNGKRMEVEYFVSGKSFAFGEDQWYHMYHFRRGFLLNKMVGFAPFPEVANDDFLAIGAFKHFPQVLFPYIKRRTLENFHEAILKLKLSSVEDRIDAWIQISSPRIVADPPTTSKIVWSKEYFRDNFEQIHASGGYCNQMPSLNKNLEKYAQDSGRKDLSKSDFIICVDPEDDKRAIFAQLSSIITGTSIAYFALRYMGFSGVYTKAIENTKNLGDWELLIQKDKAVAPPLSIVRLHKDAEKKLFKVLPISMDEIIGEEIWDKIPTGLSGLLIIDNRIKVESLVGEKIHMSGLETEINRIRADYNLGNGMILIAKYSPYMTIKLLEDNPQFCGVDLPLVSYQAKIEFKNYSSCKKYLGANGTFISVASPGHALVFHSNLLEFYRERPGWGEILNMNEYYAARITGGEGRKLSHHGKISFLANEINIDRPAHLSLLPYEFRGSSASASMSKTLHELLHSGTIKPFDRQRFYILEGGESKKLGELLNSGKRLKGFHVSIKITSDRQPPEYEETCSSRERKRSRENGRRISRSSKDEGSGKSRRRDSRSPKTDSRKHSKKPKRQHSRDHKADSREDLEEKGSSSRRHRSHRKKEYSRRDGKSTSTPDRKKNYGKSRRQRSRTPEADQQTARKRWGEIS